MEDLKIARFEKLPDTSFTLIVDDYVPLSMRTYDAPIGASYIRLGDFQTELLELIVEPNTKILRGFTLTCFKAVKTVPVRGNPIKGDGLPVFDVEFADRRRIDLVKELSVSCQAGSISIVWEAVDSMDCYEYNERLSFFLDNGGLVGVCAKGFAEGEVDLFLNR